jgi:hypothetical protein
MASYEDLVEQLCTIYNYCFTMIMLLLVWARLEQTNANSYPCSERIVYRV